MSYKCECGKEFENPQKFNGHKQGCKVHIIDKYGSWEEYLKIKNKNHENVALKIHISSLENKQNKLKKWIAEKHVCEHCGKVMTEKFGSGRFCCRACANSRNHSEKTKAKIKDSVNVCIDTKQKSKIEIYLKNPKYCTICGKIITYNNKRRKTCSKECENILHSIEAKKHAFGGITKGCGNYSKRGYYKGYKCDSTYELVFVIYNIDHNISFTRCPKDIKYKYFYKNKEHKYYPDFLMSDGSLVEIKGRKDILSELKVSSVIDRDIKILYFEDLKYAFDYVKKNYKFKKLEELYDK